MKFCHSHHMNEVLPSISSV